jgi:hypothetical protein
MKALSAAGLPAESNYLSMVNRMMEEQMPIDRASLQQMARTVNQNSGIDVQTIVQLQKLGIPITVENASQFENYLDDKQAITRELDTLIDELPTAMQDDELSTGQLRQMGSEVLSIITEGLPDVPEGVELSAEETVFPEELSQNPEAQTVPEEAAAEKNTAAAATPEAAAESTAVQETAAAAEAAPEAAAAESAPEEATVQTAQGEAVAEEEAAPRELTAQEELNLATQQQATQTPVAPHTLGAVLSAEQQQNLNQLLGGMLGVESTSYKRDSGTVEVLRDLQQILSDSLPVDREQIGKLLGSEEFKALVKDTLEQQWTVRPQELAEKNQISKLYEHLNDQIDRIENAMKASGQENTNFNQAAADVRSNVEFMNQINQAYTYVQIPLKMSGQSASGELYVYTNKKALAEGNQELTAFLHLDMEHLGPTDVSVRMLGTKVSANFYLDNDEAYDLIEKNYPVLEARLQKKGYDCTVSVVNEGKHVNFVEDFLKKDQPSAGQLHRYSFDMRA